MRYGVHIQADTYYDIEADSEEEATNIALGYFDEYIPDCEVEKISD